MLSAVEVRAYSAPEYNLKEILHYAGVREVSDEMFALVRECLSETEGKLIYKVCYREFPVSHGKTAIDLGFAETSSKDLAKALDGCESMILFAATVGHGLDRLIARYSHVSPSKALIFQAIGTERIESLCNTFCREIAEEKERDGKICRPRFSPGYGDLPIELQEDIFRVLDCPRSIGLSLNASMLMSPSKSVTAMIGIKHRVEI